MSQPQVDYAALREAMRGLCRRYPDSYWRELDRDGGYPDEFVNAMTESGYLAALIPENYGGSGLGIAEASVILEEINRSGGNAAVCHAQMYIMGSLLRHGSQAQKEYYLPRIASGDLRLQAFGVTEPDAGTDTLSIRTTASAEGEGFRVNGQKIWTSRARQSDLMLLLARTTPADQVDKRSHGLSLFLFDLRQAVDDGQVEIRPIQAMINHHSTQVFFHDLMLPGDALIGEAGKGFKYILDGMNAERILIAAESIGDGYWFVERARNYASERRVFGRAIGANQGIQFPIARAYADLRAADLMRFEAATLFDAGQACGAEANMAKLLAADAAWDLANAALQTHGGFGFATEYDIERKFRETRLYQVAPVSTNMILSYLAQHVLGMPRSY
ncbi:MAG: acyl-CoA dehydrogenase [Salinisphaeraceae bacterium]|nr:acyl-CoA dehydrogenase [Salinisphaeraceae bacterium]